MTWDLLLFVPVAWFIYEGFVITGISADLEVRRYLGDRCIDVALHGSESDYFEACRARTLFLESRK